MSASQQLLLGGKKAEEAVFVEDVFSTWLYTGNGSTQTINNGIDLAGKGGLVWIKDRSAANSNQLTDTVRGATKALSSNTTNAEITNATLYLTAFNNNGFTVGGGAGYNASSDNYASWTFRKQPKFFDVVTYTGNGTARSIAHNLGSVPGCIIIKVTSADNGWFVYHRSLNDNSGNPYFLQLNSTAAQDTGGGIFSTQTSTTFGIRSASDVNQTGQTYVAYLFAHNAGGFGLSGTDNVISCGSYIGNGDVLNVDLGFEPQWLLVKRANQANSDWVVVDNMRGAPVLPSYASYLRPNTSDAEVANAAGFHINSTGFNVDGFGLDGSFNGQYIYIAIRRGPMRTPTTGTSVFFPQTVTQADFIGSTGVPFPPDLVNTFSRNGTQRTSGYMQFQFADRLRSLGVPSDTFTGSGCPALISSSTGVEGDAASYIQLRADSQNITRSNGWNSALYGNWIYYFMRRAPGFFDVCCYTGTGVARTVAHNLTVAPELIIFKARSLSGEHWGVWVPAFGFSSGILRLSTNDAVLALSDRITGISTTTVSTGTNPEINGSGNTYVMYLFASCPGVSKVGSYTGNGGSQTINMGFTSGARFFLVKRTDSTGDWWVYDSARGIVSAADPALRLNSTTAEVTSADAVDTNSIGLIVNQESTCNINVNGAAYIYLGIS